MKTAVLYLRVSTTGQVETDYDPEGISIPAQRAACRRKAEQMGVRVTAEYVEPGRSATTMDRRPVFQQMMTELRASREADYVIVYNLSRLNRNRVDDAQVLMAMRSLGVTLVSAQENIDETPAGQLMHGILAAFNEYRSNADGADIRYKMGQKAKSGGTLGKAPLGYVNVRDTSLGREVRTVTIDTERGPLIKLAFDLYATGDYTVRSLADELNARGFRTRGGKCAPGPISRSKMQAVLRDRYYLGIITYQGIDYPGRHEPLVTRAVFDKVQTVLDAHAAAGERTRQHMHYLKGSLWCAACKRRGVESRMIIQRAIGQGGGEYFYFFCIARQSRACESRYIAIDVAENAVMRHYESISLPLGFADDVRSKLDAVLADEQAAARLMKTHLSERLTHLDQQEESLLDLAVDASLPRDKLRARLRAVAEEREALQGQLERTTTGLDAGAAVIVDALQLVTNITETYRRSSDRGRRLINQALFERLYVEDDAVHEERLKPPFDEVLYFRRGGCGIRYLRDRAPASRMHSPVPTETRVGLLELALRDDGSSKTALVDVKGLEPLTSRV